MRVAVVTKHFPSSVEKWQGHSCYQTLRLLAKRCELRVFYPEAVYPSLLTPKSSRKPALDKSWRPEGVTTSYLRFPALPLISRPLNGFAIADRLMRPVRTYAPDIILSYAMYPDGYGALRIERKLGVPVVVTSVGSDLNRIPNQLVEMLTRSTLRLADFVCTVSGDLAKTAVRLGADPERTRARLNGCDTSVFHPMDCGEARRSLGLATEGELLVYVGRMDLRKGLMELVEAVSRIKAERPKLRCILVGDGPDKEALQEAIARFDAADVIEMKPACLTDKVATWMAAADVVTLPSYAEGCPNVVIEALAAGRPMVATNVGGIPELMDDGCGRLVAPRDVDALAKALGEVLAQTWDAEAISAKHSRSWSNVADDVYTVLEETLARRKGRRQA